MSKQFLNKANGSFMGLAIGDALGAPIEGWSHQAIIDQYGYIDDFLSDEPVGTDDTEFAILTAKNLIKYGQDLTEQDVEKEWRDLIKTNHFLGGGFSEAAAINNLKSGLQAPSSGRNNPEMWSDGTAMRIAPVGIFYAGEPEKAAAITVVDGSISHAKDGIYSAQAVAAAVAVAMKTENVDEVIQAALQAIPENSWSYRLIKASVEVGQECQSIQEASMRLHDEISIHHYYWVDVGPEAVALAFGALSAAKGNYVDTVLCAVNCGRDADTIAAIAGGMAGALAGMEAIPENWMERINPVAGKCIGSVKGTDVCAVTEQLVASRGT